jgi:alpha-glucosidase
MPSFFSHLLRPSHDSAPKTHSTELWLSFLIALLLTATGSLSAQTLIRPGWVGSGLNNDPWWKQAVFYRIGDSNRPTDFKTIASELDALRTMGVDALILPMPRMPEGFAPDPELDDLDELIHQASRREMRVLLDFAPATVTADLSAVARFWLNRGVAGFHLVPPPGASPQDAQILIQSLRRVTNSAVGQRIVLSNFDPNASPTPLPAATPRQTTRRTVARRTDRSVDLDNAQLEIDPSLTQLDLPEAANLRPLLAESILSPNILLDFHPPAVQLGMPDPFPALAKAMAAILLTTHPAALIDADQDLALKPAAQSAPEAPASAAHPVYAVNRTTPLAMARPVAPPTVSLTDWYGQLSALHHGNAALRYGTVTMLNFDAQNALVWVSRPASGSVATPPVVVVCNLSSSPVQLSLESAIRNINLRGSYLRTLLRSDNAIGPQGLNYVILPPFGVYIGELHR